MLSEPEQESPRQKSPKTVRGNVDAAVQEKKQTANQRGIAQALVGSFP